MRTTNETAPTGLAAAVGSRLRPILIGPLVLLTVWFGTPVAPAPAGTYRATQCNPDLGVGRADADFRRTSEHYRSQADCGVGGEGLAVDHMGQHTNADRWGAWTVRAPVGTELIRAAAIVSGRQRGGHVPELLVGPMDQLVPVGTATGAPHPLSWTGDGAEGLRASLRCAGPDGCGSGREAHIRVRRLMLHLADAAPPSVTLSGSLLNAGSRRGSEGIAASASDAGSGIHRVFVEVNGDPVAADTPGCALAGTVATRLTPCPTLAETEFTAGTAQAPFLQGPNHVRVCATDYALDTGGNRDCELSRVRVDNACPVSGIAGGARLRLKVRDGGRDSMAYGAEARLKGRLLDSANGPVAGAEVCVATRTQLPGVPEHVVATPNTDASGRFSVTVPAGPNRRLRVAYWPDVLAAVERFRTLHVRARPRLTLLPGGLLHNGERVRFRVRLPGPRASGRQIDLKVRANGGWLPLRRGRTNEKGIWTSGYRFRATTGRQTYRFRAFVPRQRRYPYEAGQSKTRRQTVVGPGPALRQQQRLVEPPTHVVNG